jgi:hypothetical protein
MLNSGSCMSSGCTRREMSRGADRLSVVWAECALLCCVILCAALHGSLPASITQLRSLEALSLESNAFNGTLPPNLCRDMTALKVPAVWVGASQGSRVYFVMNALPSVSCC